MFLSGVIREKLGAEGAVTGGSSIKALNLLDVDVGAGKGDFPGAAWTRG